MLDAAIRESQLLEGMLASDGLVTPPPTPVLLASPRSVAAVQLDSSTTCDQSLENCGDLDESSLERLLDVCAVDFDLTTCAAADSDGDLEDNIGSKRSQCRQRDEDNGALISPSLDMMWNGVAHPANTPSPSHSDSSTDPLTRCSTPGVEICSDQQVTTTALPSKSIGGVQLHSVTPDNLRRQLSTSQTTTVTKQTVASLPCAKQRSASPIAASAKRFCSIAAINSSSRKFVSHASANQKASLLSSANQKASLLSSANQKVFSMCSTNQRGASVGRTNHKSVQLFSTNHGALTFLPVNRKYMPQRLSSDEPSVLMQKQLNNVNRKQTRVQSSTAGKARIISIPSASDLDSGGGKGMQAGRAKLAHFVLCSPSRRLDKPAIAGVTLKTKRSSQAGTSLSLLTGRRPSLLTLARPSLSSSSLSSLSSSSSSPSSTSSLSTSSSSLSSRVLRNNAVCHLLAADKRNALPISLLPSQMKAARNKTASSVTMVNQATQTGDDLEQMLGETDSTLVRLLLTGQDSSNGYRLCPDGQCITPGSSDGSSTASPSPSTSTPFEELLGPLQGRGSEMVPSSCIEADELGCFSELLSPSSSLDTPQSVW